MKNCCTTNKSCTKKSKLFSVFVLTLCAVMLVGMMFTFTACGDDEQEYANFAEVKLAAAEQNKPILLYISKKPCENCNDFKPYWQEYKEQYGEQIIFFTTTINVDSEATTLFSYYNEQGDTTMSGAPSVVWVNAQGEYIQKKTGGSTCAGEIVKTITEGLANWWTPTAEE